MKTKYELGTKVVVVSVNGNYTGTFYGKVTHSSDFVHILPDSKYRNTHGKIRTSNIDNVYPIDAKGIFLS